MPCVVLYIHRNSSHSANQSLTLEVFTIQTGHRTHLTSGNISVAGLLGRLKEEPDGKNAILQYHGSYVAQHTKNSTLAMLASRYSFL
jgi:hypothetical protein